MSETRPLRSHAGDVGRRVRHRREQLGLSREQLSEQAGMAPQYLAYVEEGPAQIDGGQLFRLAAALDVTVSTLLGGDAGGAPGAGGAGTRPQLEPLTEVECWELVGDHGIGRLALLVGSEPAPIVVPLNYRVADRTLYARIAEGHAVDATLAAHGGRCPASFEIDRIDDAQRAGWSVLVQGVATTAAANEAVADVEPWAGGSRERSIRLSPAHVTGRRIVSG